MTVVQITSNGEVWCEWFDNKQEPQQRGFKPTTLIADDGGPVIG